MRSTFFDNEIKFYNDDNELCCFECRATGEIQMHHIVPKSRGGEKMISICYVCHQKAHHKKAKSVAHSELIKEGIAKSRAAGKKWGSFTPDAQKLGRATASKAAYAKRCELGPILHGLRLQGLTNQKISDLMNEKGYRTTRGKKWHRVTVHKTLKKWMGKQFFTFKPI